MTQLIHSPPAQRIPQRSVNPQSEAFGKAKIVIPYIRSESLQVSWIAAASANLFYDFLGSSGSNSDREFPSSRVAAIHQKIPYSTISTSLDRLEGHLAVVNL